MKFEFLKGGIFINSERRAYKMIVALQKEIIITQSELLMMWHTKNQALLQKLEEFK